jgi:hypothetical protein
LGCGSQVSGFQQKSVNNIPLGGKNAPFGKHEDLCASRKRPRSRRLGPHSLRNHPLATCRGGVTGAAYMNGRRYLPTGE